MVATRADLEAYSAMITEARVLDFTKMKLPQILPWVERILTTRRILRLGVRHDSNQVWWKVRRVEAPGDRFDCIREVSINRTATGFMRANGPGMPTLYASRSQTTALFECDAKPGEIFQLVSCRAFEHPDNEYNVDLVGEVESIQNRGVSLLAHQQNVETIRQFAKDNPFAVQIAALADEFLAEQFAIPSNSAYRITAYCGWQLLQDGHAVAFPSVKDKGGINIAVPEATFDEKFEVLTCQIVRIKNISMSMRDTVAVNPLGYSSKFDSEGRITWMTQRDAHEHVHFTWSKDGGHMAPPGTKGWRDPSPKKGLGR